MATERITVTDRPQATETGASIHVGKAFAFIGKETFSSPGLGWLRQVLGTNLAASPKVVSLLGPQPTLLPGVKIAPAELPEFRLRSITSDKALYRTERDRVNVFVLSPTAPGTTQTVEIFADGVEFARHPVALGKNGEGTLALNDLPVGEYEVGFKGAPDDEPKCMFTVAEYRLSPLTAFLTEHVLSNGDTLRVKLRLESFGVPVEDRVQIELLDRGRRIASKTVQSAHGDAETSFKLEGKGPYTLNLQLTGDTSKTATVPIPGSRASERKQTLFSGLGVEVQGTLLPTPGTTPVRGLYLEETAQVTTPFLLERVVADRARLRVMADIETLRIVVVDPNAVVSPEKAIDPKTVKDPGTTDPVYRAGAELFEKGDFPGACTRFQEARENLSAPHPFYSYYVACCFARMNRAAEAVVALRESISEGWSDFDHLGRDEDLASLRGAPEYEALKLGGRREIVRDDVKAGEMIEIAVEKPLELLAVGAFVNGKPWEGWACLVKPSRATATLHVPERCEPGSRVRIRLETGGAAASAYLIVKDARLLSADMPNMRLAGCLKSFAESASSALSVGYVGRMLADLLPPEHQYYPPTGALYRGGGPIVYKTSMPVPSPSMTLAGGYAVPAAPPPPGSPPSVDFLGGHSEAGAAPSLSEVSAGKPVSASKVVMDDPEVLFAGLVELADGVGSVEVTVGDGFGDYVAEAFVIAGDDWRPVEARFRAEKDPFLELRSPAFVHAEDGALGRIHVSAKSGRVALRLTCDGQSVPLFLDGRELADGEPISGVAEISFLAESGEYEAVLTNLETGDEERLIRRVSEPGKLRRTARTLLFLEPGQKISLDDNLDFRGLRVLPGLDSSFEALVEATADYGHACCEQTAAKLLAACGMYVFAETSAKRKRAESIILAGVKREKSMWLKGRGFKMYPESSNEPNTYYGPKAARYLWNLDLLRNLKGELEPSPALRKGINAGLEMAADTSKAYKIAWPPRDASSCEEAYFAARFNSDAGVREKAVEFVERKAAENGGNILVPRNQYGYGVVTMRAETAYAGATLFLAGGPSDRRTALRLANTVVKDLGESGMLYSTVDSVAAIALMGELEAAGILGNGTVSVNGRSMPTAEASDFAGEIRSVEGVEGTNAVELLKYVTEDWNSLGANLQVRISLEKDGRTTRRLTAGDSVDLKVKLEEGYKAGDLLWVSLPDSLTRIVGGGQVKLFSVDFRGESELTVPLAATSVSLDKQGRPGTHHFAVCVRNMFEEERVGSFGFLTVTVESPEGGNGGASLFGRAVKAVRKLLE